VLGQVDIRTFGINVYLIIGAVVVLVILFPVIITVWTLLKIAFWQAEVRRAQRQAAKERLADDGQPYPPAGRGLCDVCGKATNKVYHLSSGRRMCDDCYRWIDRPVEERVSRPRLGEENAGPPDRADELERTKDDERP
jgi:hypothetical protein